MALRRISKEELTEILSEHEKWLDSNGKEGKRADLSYRNLRKADLSGAHLSEANLSGANLSRANLSVADLFGADLSGTNLSRANLFGANLSGANLSGANLSRANLFGANLSRTNLFRADLFGVDLSRADLSRADLYCTNVRNAKLDFALQCPEKGEFVAYKKAYDSESKLPCIVKLHIPADALRSSATTKKCRCNKAKVLSITSLDNERKYQKAFSLYDATFIYEVEKTVEVSDFDRNRWKECAPGIHFFMCRMDAVNY